MGAWLAGLGDTACGGMLVTGAAARGVCRDVFPLASCETGGWAPAGNKPSQSAPYDYSYIRC
jgi:hypothetical protein